MPRDGELSTQIRLRLGDETEGGVPVGRLADLLTRPFQMTADHFSDRILIFDDQDSLRPAHTWVGSYQKVFRLMV